MKQTLILGTMFVLILGFQNCSNSMNFSGGSSGLVSAKGDLVPVFTNEPSVPATGGGSNTSSTSSNHPAVVQTHSEVEHDGEKDCEDEELGEGHDGDDHDGEDHDREACHGEEEAGDDHAKASDQQNSVCILEGPGESIKLGLSEENLVQGVKAVSRVLCMSQKACLEIASTKFKVKEAEERAYCKESGNPNVVHIGDADLAAKIVQ